MFVLALYLFPKNSFQFSMLLGAFLKKKMYNWFQSLLLEIAWFQLLQDFVQLMISTGETFLKIKIITGMGKLLRLGSIC